MAYKHYLLPLGLLAPAVIWFIMLPTKIIGLHNIRPDAAVIVVNNFPDSDSERIKWWTQHQATLQQKFSIPQGDVDFTWFIYEAHYQPLARNDSDRELICFPEIESRSNCIRKNNLVLRVRLFDHGGIIFNMDYNSINCREYRQPSGSNEIYQVY